MLDFDKKARTADYNAEMKVIRGVTRWDRKRNEDLYKQSNNAAKCSSDPEQTSMVWPCHEERGRINAEGCNEVKDELMERDQPEDPKVAIQHR